MSRDDVKREQRELYQKWLHFSAKHRANERLKNNPSTICNGRQAHLYIMKYEDSHPGRYKVGRTGDFEKRVKTLNAGHISNLMYVAKYENLGHIELLVHDELSPYKVQCCSREWFCVPLNHITAIIKTISGTLIGGQNSVYKGNGQS